MSAISILSNFCTFPNNSPISISKPDQKLHTLIWTLPQFLKSSRDYNYCIQNDTKIKRRTHMVHAWSKKINLNHSLFLFILLLSAVLIDYDCKSATFSRASLNRWQVEDSRKDSRQECIRVPTPDWLGLIGHKQPEVCKICLICGSTDYFNRITEAIPTN